MTTEAPARRPTIALFIPALKIGGAERQLVELATNLDRRKWRVLVLTLDDRRDLSLDGDHAVECLSLGGARGITALRRLNAIIREQRVDILQAILLGAQVYALGLKMLHPRLDVVIAVRSSTAWRDIDGWKGRLSHALVFGLRFLVTRYVFNSSAGEREIGARISPRRRAVIYNGIDTDRFKSNPEVRAGRSGRAVGIVANVNSDKGYDTFVEAAALVAREIPDATFVAIGEHRNTLGTRIAELVARRSLQESFRFLGPRSDVEKLLPTLDVICSASRTEGFSNAIAEAMACEIPCVVTDVGDSSLIAGNAGIVVPPNDPVALSAAIIRVLRLSNEARTTLGRSARRRIESEFGVMPMVARYEKLYGTILRERSHPEDGSLREAREVTAEEPR